MRLAIAGATGTVGRHVVRAAESRGHRILPLTRSSGQDLVSGNGLADVLHGIDVVIDVTSVLTTDADVSRRFFGAVTRTLLGAGREAGVGHHLALSICGIDGIDAGYYAGKLVQERAVKTGLVPWSILRATQFHEFAEQILARVPGGPVTPIPAIAMRPVAAREVGAVLVDLAEAGPSSSVTNLSGPTDERLADLVRRLRRHDGARGAVVEVRLPGAYWKRSASGVLRGPEDARRGAIGFTDWLDSEDHTPVR